MMSELKAYEDYWMNDVYDKDEADAVLAEKDKEIAELKEQVQEERSAKVNYKISANDLNDGLKDAYEEIKHHKYKRCLAMAKQCGSSAQLAWDHDFSFNNNQYAKRALFCEKWRKRWLKIAEKFKEAKV